MSASVEEPAVILAAGLGSRLDDGTELHKCLRPVFGRPLIARILDALATAGIRTVNVVVGNAATQVESALRSMDCRCDIRTSRCDDWMLGNGRTAVHARTLVGDAERFLLVMSDHLISAEHVTSTLRAGAASGSRCVVATSPAGGSGDTGDATKLLVTPDDVVVAIGKALESYNAVDTGVFSMTPALFSALDEAQAGGDYSLTGGNRVLIGRTLLTSCSIGDIPWQDVDTPADLEAAEELAKRIQERD